MLDQNTDRMWYVIGAVIVGAAIIFLANGTLPSLFATVTDTFHGAVSTASGAIERQFPPAVDLAQEVDGVTPARRQYVEPHEMSRVASTQEHYDPATRTYTMRLTPNASWSSGFRIRNDANYVVPYGSILKLEYDVRPPKDLYARNDINNSTIHSDGSLIYVNDGDDLTNRIGQLRRGEADLPEMFAPADEWTTLTMYYRNKNGERNPDSLPLLDSTIFGIRTEEPLTVEFRNIQISIFEE